MNAALTPAGLPDYRERTSDHSVSNHRRNVRGPPGCPTIRLSAYRPLYRLRHSLEGSPIHADRIEFTCLCVSRRCYGLVVLVPLLSTPCCHDAVTVRYPTTLRRRETDFHRSVFPPSQAHERAHPGRSRSPTPSGPATATASSPHPRSPQGDFTARVENEPTQAVHAAAARMAALRNRLVPVKKSELAHHLVVHWPYSGILKCF